MTSTFQIALGLVITQTNSQAGYRADEISNAAASDYIRRLNEQMDKLNHVIQRVIKQKMLEIPAD